MIRCYEFDVIDIINNQILYFLENVEKFFRDSWTLSKMVESKYYSLMLIKCYYYLHI